MIEVKCNDSELVEELLKSFRSGEAFKLLGFEYMPTRLAHDYSSLLGYSVEFDADPVMRARSEWTGSGLPPVGVDCEFTHTGLTGEWVKCHVVGYYKGHLYGHTDHHLWNYKGGACHVQLDEGLPTAVIFRPIRTPEQIARDEEIAQMVADGVLGGVWSFSDAKGDAIGIASALYDAGYRKQPTNQPQEDK